MPTLPPLIALLVISVARIPAVSTKARELLTVEDQVAAFNKKIDVGGYSLYLNCSARPNNAGPTVVFGSRTEPGLRHIVQAEVAKFTRVCSYDRAGLGTSDAAPSQRRTGEQMVKDLHVLL